MYDRKTKLNFDSRKSKLHLRIKIKHNFLHKQNNVFVFS